MARPEVTGRKISTKTEREADRIIPGSPSADEEPADAEQADEEQADAERADARAASRPEVAVQKIGAESAKRTHRIRGPPSTYAEKDAFSVAEFCQRHGVSVQLFYKFRDQMPATFRVGSRVLISREAAAEWRRERETAA